MKAYLNSFFFLFFIIGFAIADENTANVSGVVLYPEGYPDKKNAVVYIDGLNEKLEAAYRTKVTKNINQIGMEYVPFLTVLTPGSKVIFTNSDPHLHTVKSESGPLKPLRFAMTPNNRGYEKRKYERTVKSTGFSELLCDVHSQMRAYVAVVPTDHFAVTDENGKFTFSKPLPPFPFQIRVWHDVLPPTTVYISSAEDLKLLKEIRLKTWDVTSL